MKREPVLHRNIPKNATLCVVNDLLDIGGIADDPDVEENLVNVILMQVMNATVNGTDLFVFVPTVEMKEHINEPDMIVSNQKTADVVIEVNPELSNPIVIPAKSLFDAENKLKRIKRDLKNSIRR